MSVQTGAYTAVPETRANLPPPEAPVLPVTHCNHGDERVDHYYWLQERDNPAVLAYLEAENRYTEAMLNHTEALQVTLYDEMKSRIKETDDSVPVAHGGYFYYYREEKGKQYRIYCRRKGSLDANEQILIDLNEEAEGRDYLRMGNFKVSPDHSLLAFALDTDGSETFTLQVKNLATWAADSARRSSE